MVSIVGIVVEIACLCGLIGFCYWILRKVIRELNEIVDLCEERAYRRGVSHGWDVCEKWGEHAGRQSFIRQARGSDN